MVGAGRSHASYGITGRGQNRSGQTPDEEHDGENEPFPELFADIGPGRQLALAAADGPRGFHEIAEQDKERNEQQPRRNERRPAGSLLMLKWKVVVKKSMIW